MNEQWIEVTNLPLFAMVFGKWEMMIIDVVKNFIESAEQGCHAKIHVSMAKINGGIDEYRFRFFIAHEIPAPEIAMEQCRFFEAENVRQPREEIFKSNYMFFIEELVFRGQFYLRLKTGVDEKIIPFQPLIIMLDQ